MRYIIGIVTSTLLAIPSAVADTDYEQLHQQVKTLIQSVESLNQRINQLEEENTSLKKQQNTTESDVKSLENQASTAPPPTVNTSGKVNPDIGIVFDFVGTATEQKAENLKEDEGFDRFSVREIELNIGHDIDPFTRFDSTITFSDFEDVGIEEGYVAYANLPAEFSGRAGRFRLPIGLSNPYHRDQLFSVDEPLVVQRYLGAEGLFRTGVELSRHLPQWNDGLTQHLRIGMVEGGIGEGGTLFGESRQRPTYYARLRNELELSANGTLDLGTSFLHGSADEKGRSTVKAYGFDAQYVHRFATFNTLTLQAEALLQDRDDALTNEAKDDPWGYYALANYRASQRWGFGGRFDDIEMADYDPFNPIDPFIRDDERAYSAWVTFHQSEFSRWRLQYQRTEFASGLDDDQLMLQGTFILGWHQHAAK